MSKAMSYFYSFLMMVKEVFSLENMQMKLKENKAQTWMEYGMIIGGIILVIVLVIGFFGDELLSLFQSIKDSIGIREPEGGTGGGGAW